MNERASRIMGWTLGGAGLVMAISLFWTRVESGDAPMTPYETWTAIQGVVMLLAAKTVYPPYRGGR